jgi:hypothetical protein
MSARTSVVRRVGVGAVAAVLAVLAMPASASGAGQPTHESYRMSGVLADAKWPAGEPVEAPVGTPRILYVMGAKATSTYRAPGEKPERMAQPPLIAMGLTMPGVDGAEPYEAELWCTPVHYTFTVAKDLSKAALDIPSCVADVFTFDEETGEESPTGVTVTIGATARWTATGPLERQHMHSKYTVGTTWSIDMAVVSLRPARADLTVTGLPGGPFAGTTAEAMIQRVKAGTLLHQ